MNRRPIHLAYVVAMLLMSHTAVAQLGKSDPPSILVYGSVEIEEEPDYVTWRVTVTDHHANALTAKQNNDKRFDALLKIGKDLDIAKQDTIKGHVSIIKRTEYNKEKERYEFKDYEVKRTLVLMQRKMDELDEMLEALAQAGVEFKMSYESSRLDKLKREARLKAVAVAREKAVEMADELGQRIGRPLRVRELDGMSAFDLDDALGNTSIRHVDGKEVGVRHGAISVLCAVEVEFMLIDQ